MKYQTKKNSDEADAIANLKDEIKAIAQYDADIDRVTDPELKELLTHIKGEEEGHRTEIEEFLKKKEIAMKNANYPSGSGLDKYGADVRDELERIANMDTSDAQGIMSTKQELMKQCYHKGMSYQDAAKAIDKASMVNKNSDAGSITPGSIVHMDGHEYQVLEDNGNRVLIQPYGGWYTGSILPTQTVSKDAVSVTWPAMKNDSKIDGPVWKSLWKLIDRAKQHIQETGQLTDEDIKDAGQLDQDDKKTFVRETQSVKQNAGRKFCSIKKNKEDPYYKGGKHLTEWENKDLNLKELKDKLEALEEMNDDAWLIGQVKQEIRYRETGKRNTKGNSYVAKKNGGK